MDCMACFLLLVLCSAIVCNAAVEDLDLLRTSKKTVDTVYSHVNQMIIPKLILTLFQIPMLKAAQEMILQLVSLGTMMVPIPLKQLLFSTSARMTQRELRSLLRCLSGPVSQCSRCISMLCLK